MDKKQLNKLISCFTMVDGGLYKRSEGSNAYFQMNMLSCHMDYIDWVKDTFEKLVHVNKTQVANPCKRPQTNLNSRTHPELTKIWARIYRDDGYKSLDEHWIKSMDWEMLAIFYMCDGGLYVDPPNVKKGLVNPSPNVSLYLKRLSYGDQWFLKKSLKDNLDLEFNINKHSYKGKIYYFLRLRNKDVDKFMEGVRPHIKNSFRYKLYDSVRKAREAEPPGDDIV